MRGVDILPTRRAPGCQQAAKLLRRDIERIRRVAAFAQSLDTTGRQAPDLRAFRVRVPIRSLLQSQSAAIQSSVTSRRLMP